MPQVWHLAQQLWVHLQIEKVFINQGINWGKPFHRFLLLLINM